MPKKPHIATPAPPPEKADAKEPRLFGLAQSNRARGAMWGKNCFNSSFPAALACYMRAQKIRPVYVRADADKNGPKCVNGEISVDDVFNVSANVRNEDLFFSFETKFAPYLAYVADEQQLDGVDLAIRRGEKWLRPLQIKLTVIPDNTTAGKAKDDWGPELVFRPADTCSCALGIFAGLANRADEVAEIFRNPCAKIQDWNNAAEMAQHKEGLLDCVGNFLATFHKQQNPYLLQQIWMTKGKSPFLAKKSFDIFVWSDYALIFAYLEKARKEAGLNRATRAVARFARIQYELADSSRRKVDIRRINRDMTFLLQTDKEVALSGLDTGDYMTSPRRHSPAMPPSVLKKIILNNGHKLLSPERRFDQTVYFTAEKYFK